MIPSGNPGVVFDIGGERELPAGFQAFENQGFQASASRVRWRPCFRHNRSR